MFLRIISTLGHVAAKYLFVKCSLAFAFLICSCYIPYAQVKGCPDPIAKNYNNSAAVNTGSCIYNKVTIKPKFDVRLSNKVHETSGLLWCNNQLWTHTDSGGEPALYAVDTATGKILKKVTITNATNTDWEDLAQDDDYIYIGDFGNNAHGNRRDLKIYRVKKSDVESKTSVTATIINFAYSDQTNFAKREGENTNFDCEAMIAYGDSLFLFSKDWIDNKTRLYKLPKLPGTYMAINVGSLNVHGLVTGATVIADKKVIVLTGYSTLMMPFLYLLYDFSDDKFFAANKRKISIKQNFLQVEGICPITDTNFYISNEKVKKLIKKPAMLQTINLTSLLEPYYASLPSKTAPVAKHTNAYSAKEKSIAFSK